ncbi:T9SS type A sorting domain-containing protein [Kordia sp. YSTF-M3]|uniref:T9SS type A sorting domain-containing protein n=1 Tax=Kordia aestuariivivens TaxID=2759037 RepID=A0ABR7Q9V1_9FLAO|nr:T9SS type A sorting domain-containing protein [Kordia aestuariivivens]MBC8755198.1 T9SS type A sorting domain-containing protein [Kordia aestuariivivens]
MKRGLYLLLLLSYISVNGQSFNSWLGHYSYNNVIDISLSSDKIYGASENAFFTYDLQSNEIEKFSTVNGLSGEEVSTAYFSESAQKYVIGYNTGLIEVFDADTEEIRKVVDIVDKPTIPPNKKNLNHILEYNGILYISTNYGISLYNINVLEFGDTYFIGPNGSQIEVRQTTILGEFIYAATNVGVFRAVVDNDNLIDFAEWQRVITSNWQGIIAFGEDLYAVNNNRRIYKYNGTSFTPQLQIPQYATILEDLKVNDTYMTLVHDSKVHIYDTDLNEVLGVDVLDEYPDLEFNSALLLDNTIYLGTETEGILEASFPMPSAANQILPDGPLLNNTFSITAIPNELWVVYGDYNAGYNPYPLDRRGVSHLQESGWTNIPYTSEFDAVSLVHATVNPSNTSEVFISSFFSGILKIEDNVPTEILNVTNSGLESLDIGVPTYIDIRIGETKYDANGDLWVLNSKIENGIKVLRSGGQWDSYSISEAISNPVNGENGLSKIEISDNNIKFIATQSHGVLAFDETRSDGSRFTKLSEEEEGNLPTTDVRALAIDKTSNLWIGTVKGIRVYFGADNIFDDGNPQSNDIIIVDEDGVPKELLFEQTVTDIEVDGSNNKWIATSASGVFYMSSDATETLAHFTKDNSPLPTNVVNNIEIDSETGRVYIATAKGLLSYQGTATGPKETLDNVYVYPNPVRPGFSGNLTITGLINNANVKITDIEGNLVYETTSDGGTLLWDLTAFGKHKVASGVYLILIANQDGTETKVTKVMVVR